MKESAIFTKKFTRTVLAATIGMYLNQATFAAVIPSSAEPGVISKILSAPPIQAPVKQPTPVAQPQEKKPAALSTQAEKIKFKLNQVILEDNKVYSTKELQTIYQDKVGKIISVADLQAIVQNITNYYRNNGYILSRAILPPQHVANGVVHIRIVEGYIAKANVQGVAKRAKYLLAEIGNKIAESKPTRVKIMEYYLRIANEIPGMDARAVLEPSKTDIGASDIDLIANEKSYSGYISYDNYGTRYIGPNQVTANITGNSLFQSGDSTKLTVVRTARPQQLQYEDFSHDIPLGPSGARITVGVNDSHTSPGLNLADIHVSGDSTNFYSTINYPLIRSRDHDLSLTGGINYIDSYTNTFDFTLYNDHIRSANIGVSYDSTDRFYGSNNAAAHLEHGFVLLGASSDPKSQTVSRYGADGHYTKLTANIGRLQQIYWRLSAFVYASGQYSWEPLLSSAQYAFGGSQLGRGYDSAEIIGDRGAAGSIEIRLDDAPNWFLLKTIEPYIFYDTGVIWDMKDTPGTKLKQSAASTGLGMRFTFTKNFSGNLLFAQPLTKQVNAEESVGQGRKPRGFFSIVGSI